MRLHLPFADQYKKLSAAMLGDTAENSKNPLKKAMKRRKAKTVQFTAPTFVEASDYDYSSDEEDGLMPEPLYGNGNQNQHEDAKSVQDKSSSGTDIATTVVEVARVETPDLASPAKDIKAPAEEPLSSPTLVDKTGILLNLLESVNVALTLSHRSSTAQIFQKGNTTKRRFLPQRRWGRASQDFSHAKSAAG